LDQHAKAKESSDATIAMRRKQLAHDQSWRLAESQRDSAVKYVSVTLKGRLNRSTRAESQENLAPEADDVWTEELLIEGNPNCRVFNALWVVEPALGEQPRRFRIYPVWP
jgi:hypothetical protein